MVSRSPPRPTTIHCGSSPVSHPKVFRTTRWTEILRTQSSSAAEADAGWAWLVRIYGPAVEAFLRGWGMSESAARETAQNFFADLHRRGDLKRLEPGETRFRSWLLRCLKNRTIDTWRSTQARPETEWPELTPGMAGWEPRDPRLRPDEAFERRWALDLLERVVVRLEEQYSRSPRHQELFKALISVLHNEPESTTLRDTAKRLGMNEGSVRNAHCLLRERYGQLIRAEVAATVTNDADVDDEWQNLRQILAR